MGLFKKNDKQTAVAFVDYEHWFYSYTNKFNMSPNVDEWYNDCLLYTSPSPRDPKTSRMPSSA